MKRIMIIGSAGSGKSTAAQMIGAALDLPVYHMDRDVYWLAGWQERPDAERMPLVREIVARDAWVFEGAFSRSYPVREERAELLLWLATPLLVRLLRVLRRAFRYRGQSRPDLAPGCVEEFRMLPGFLWFILSTSRRSRSKQAAIFAASELPKHRFTTASEVNAFVATLKAPGQ